MLHHGIDRFLVAVGRHGDVLRHDAEYGVLRADAEARRTHYVCVQAVQLELVAKHCDAANIANREL